MTDNRSILDTPMPGNDADAATIRVFLLELLATLWREGEGFSGKRPFGNSGWQHAVYHALVEAGQVAADLLITRALRDTLGHQEVPSRHQVAYQGTEWCVWYGGPDQRGRRWPRNSPEPSEPVVVRSFLIEWHRHGDGLWHSYRKGSPTGTAYAWHHLSRVFPLTEVLDSRGGPTC